MSVSLNDAKSAFVGLACCGAEADNWNIPEAKRKGSFDAKKANALGLSALLPRDYDKSKGEAPAVADKASKQQEQQKQAAAPKPAAAPIFRGWGVPTASGKSLAEEMAQKH